MTTTKIKRGDYAVVDNESGYHSATVSKVTPRGFYARFSPYQYDLTVRLSEFVPAENIRTIEPDGDGGNIIIAC